MIATYLCLADLFFSLHLAGPARYITGKFSYGLAMGGGFLLFLVPVMDH